MKSALRDSDDHKTVYLARPDPFVDHPAEPLLFRELQRQALLIAARDELGLATRDEVLREFSSTAPGAPSALKFCFDANENSDIVSHLSWTGRSDCGSASTGIGVFGHFGYYDETANIFMAEIDSHRRWVDILHQAGFSGSTPDANDGPAPQGVETLLNQTTLLAPLAAVQKVHAAIRKEGASPARLSALVRGYANLALLTRFQWSTNTQVFSARALLYGQRIVSQWPKTPLAYWSRAYAEALVGLHKHALDDVTTARRLQPGGVDAARWTELIEPLCKYDTAALTDAIAADQERAPLAALLAFVTVEQSGSAALTLELGKATLRFNPACFHTLDVMCHAAGVGPGAGLTAMAPNLLVRSLTADVDTLTGVTPEVYAAMKNLKVAARSKPPSNDGLSSAPDELAAAEQSLVDASAVAVEPSLVLAGRLAQETTFVHVERRSMFIVEQWSVDASDYIAAAKPLIAAHPYHTFVDAMALPKDQRSDAARLVVIDDAQECMNDILWQVTGEDVVPGKMAASLLDNRAYQNSGCTAYDISTLLSPYVRKPKHYDLDLTDLLRATSPNCPMIEAARVRDHGDEPVVRKETTDWNAFSQQPATLAALAKRADREGDQATAELMLEQYTKIAGDITEARELAKWYLSDGNDAKWLATLEGIIKRPDYGLDHARAQTDIALHFMKQGNYKRALPYADAAEETQAYWAMKCDADCHRALGDTAAADRIIAEAKAHYGH